MLVLPSTTIFNKRIPKQKFYENMDVSTALKRVFVEQIEMIQWKNKIAPTTMNIAPGTRVNEIQVFEISLHQKDLDESVLRQIDKTIPYFILFIFSFEDQYQAWIAYKELVANSNKSSRISKYYHTEWLTEDEMNLHIEGLDLDAVYDNFVRQIAGGILNSHPEEDLVDTIERTEKIQKIKKEIAKLEKQARAEKQPKKKFELVKKINSLKGQL